MNNPLRPLLTLSGQSIAYGIGFFGRQLVVYLTLPLITTIMPQIEFGIVSVITSFYTVLVTITNMSLPSATFRLFNDQDDERFQQSILGTSQMLFLVFAVVAALILGLFAEMASLSLTGSADFALTLRIVALLLVIETLNYYGNILLRIQVRPKETSIHSVVYILSQMGFALTYIYYFNLGVVGYWLGFLTGGLIGLVLMVWYNRKWIYINFSIDHAKELLSYSLPLIPATLSINFLQLTDRYFIRSIQGLEAVAIYAIGYKIGSFVNMILAPFSIAWPNFAFSTMNEPDAKRTYRDILTYLLFGSTFIVLATYIFRFELIDLVSPTSYQGAASVVVWIAISMTLYRIYPVMSLGPRIKKKTAPLAWIAVLTAIVNILLHLLLIPKYSILGAAIATMISFILLTTISHYVSRRYYHFPLDWRRMILILIAAVVTAIAGNYAIPQTGNLLVTLLVKGIILIVYPIVLILLRFLSFDEFKDLFSDVIYGIRKHLSNPQPE
jgi:O-antigen/teichoic acid export membrane protein